MAQEGKEMRVGVCGRFAYNSVKLDLLVNSNGYDVDSNTFFSK
jgi:hypothetical protein